MVDLNKYSGGVQHIGVPCSDIDRTVEFYKSLGFEEVLITRNEVADETVAFLKLGNLVIEAYGNRPTEGLEGAIDHIALDVKDIDALYAEIVAAGHESLEGGVKGLPFWERGVRFFTILGPDKEKIEFCEKL